MHETLHAIKKVNKKIRTSDFPYAIFLTLHETGWLSIIISAPISRQKTYFQWGCRRELLDFSPAWYVMDGALLVVFSSCQNTFACRARIFTGFADSGTPTASSGTTSVATGATSHWRVDAIATYAKTKAIAVNRQRAVLLH